MKKVGGMKVVTEEGGSVDAHCNNANNILNAARQQHQQQQFLDEIGQSMSSASSFSYDGKEGENDDDGAESIMSDQIRPSQHPTSIRKLPSSIHPPPPPASMRTPPSPVSRHSFGGDWTPEWTPGADSVGGGGRGASENIRMGSDSNQFCDREYNDDIDDCILEPVVTSQYPPVDHPEQPLNPMLPHFCYPQGIEHIVPSHEYKMPRIHHFVLTDSAGGKLYGTCLTVYEEFSIGDSSDDTSNFDDDISLLSAREEDQERANIEISMDGSPKVVRARRRSRHHTYYAPR
eukprot:scaffold9222_cov104-Skeletonema_dohrnii-CCMP3373.AAC.1